MSPQVVDDNPFTALEEAAKRRKWEDEGQQAIATSRTKLILGKDPKSVFFSILALKLQAKPDWTCNTAWTDGRFLGYNPKWVAELGTECCIGMIVHEVMHNSQAHTARRGHREPKKWNIACDLAINSILHGTGFKLPANGCIPGEGTFSMFESGLSAEEYYNKLPDCKTLVIIGGGDGDGDEDPGGCGGVRDAGDPAQQQQMAADWKIATAQAQQVAKQRGELPTGLARAVDDFVNPKVDWRSRLRQFVTKIAKNDYAWTPPNRRFVHMGMYLPSLRSEELGDLATAIDTSGSIDPETLRTFATELQAILETFVCKLTIIYCDAAVGGTQEWRSEDGPLIMEPVGGGGTSHVPVFEHIENNMEPPVCLVCLTDGYTQFPKEAPPYPVMWVMTTDVVAPFGETIKIED